MTLTEYLLASLAALSFNNSAHSATLQGKVVKIADGDTITVLSRGNEQQKIRLVGIDAPEKRQPFGNRSKQHLSTLVFGKTVQVDWQKKDRYGRILGKIRVPSQSCKARHCPADMDVNLAQIKAGLAWHYKQYAKEQSPRDRHAYADSEIKARTGKVGLWSMPGPVAPWDFRRR